MSDKFHIGGKVRLTEIRKQIASSVEQGLLDVSVIECLREGSDFVPAEGDFIDYKRQLPTDRTSFAKVIVSIVSFYNTYGGYLIFGVDQDDYDQKFTQYGLGDDQLDVKELADTVKAYTGKSIEIGYKEFLVGAGINNRIGLLHIPKRPKDQTPLAFGRNGPDTKGGKPIFRQDEVYYRNHDNCEVAKKAEDWTRLLGTRIPSLGTTESALHALAFHSEIIDHNLPDRNFICSKFVGRDSTIQQLWQWLGDDFSVAKILAGEGGLGKTSIAYQFSEQICKEPPCGFERVLWLTAKAKQFKGLEQAHVKVPETHFDNYTSCLLALAERSAILDDELREASPTHIKRRLYETFSVIPTFVVIDDLDSLSNAEQRSLQDLVMQMAGTKSRFLLTTRMNQAYGDASCIRIEGLNEAEYLEYLSNWQERFKSLRFSPDQIKRLHKSTGGSPLFTESILRLLNTGMSLEVALREWSGNYGADARHAALKRELDRLTPEAKRVLLAVAYFTECSYTEIKQVTAYGNEKLQQAITELQSLFLLSAPQITEEGRFRIAPNTSLLVLEEHHLIPGWRDVEAAVRRVKYGDDAQLSKAKTPQIAIVITQANAHLRDADYRRARETVDAGLRRYKDNADLLLMKGRVLDVAGNGETQEARRLFQRAYDVGQRKALLFKLWFKSELESLDHNGAIGVATQALQVDDIEKDVWYYNRAVAYLKRSSDRERENDLLGAIDDMSKCREDIRNAITLSGGKRRGELVEACVLASEDVWRIMMKRPEGPAKWAGAFDEIKHIFKRGEISREWLVRMITTLRGIFKQSLTSKGKIHVSKVQPLFDRIVEAREMVIALKEHSIQFDLERIDMEIAKIEKEASSAT